jgi:predicted double-glycine peptidase
MILEYYTGETYHPHTYYNEMGTVKNEPQSLTDLNTWMESKGVPGSVQVGWSLETLRLTVQQGIPVAVLIEVPSGGHIVLVVGMTRNNVYVHDPREGPNQRIPIEEFEAMWNYPASWQENRVIVPDEKP